MKGKYGLLLIPLLMALLGAGILAFGVTLPLFILLLAVMSGYVVYLVIRLNRSRFRRLKRLIMKQELVRTAAGIREAPTMAGLLAGLVMNSLYALYELVSCMVYGTRWFGVMALYYLLLTGIRLSLFVSLCEPIDETDQYRRLRKTGWELAAFTVLLAVMGVLCIRSDMVFPRHNLVLSCIFAVVQLALTGRSLFKDHDLKRPLLAAAHRVSDAKMLTSLFALGTALTASALPSAAFRPVNITVGTVILGAEALMSLRMIRGATRRIRELTGCPQ